MSRTVKTSGDIEPCKLSVKANAPLRRFAALKELIVVKLLISSTSISALFCSPFCLSLLLYLTFITHIAQACDAFVEELKPKVPSLSGLFERSDAMLANYPGEGSRCVVLVLVLMWMWMLVLVLV
jgi:hypothetical protein